MTGRSLFKRIEFFLFFLAAIMKLTPRAFRVFLLQLFGSCPTMFGVGIRYVLVKSIANNVGDNFYVGRWCVLKNIDCLSVGDNVSIHDQCYIDAKGGVTIGSNVSIAHQSSILSFEHSFNDSAIPIKYQPLILKPIVIEDDVWIGAGVRVLGGLSIGYKTVIGANSVVTSSISHGVYVGAPCRKIKEL